jgi:hypothetical protein
MRKGHRTGTPVAIVMGGGYADNVEDTVDIHAETVFAAAAAGFRSATATSR